MNWCSFLTICDEEIEVEQGKINTQMLLMKGDTEMFTALKKQINEELANGTEACRLTPALRGDLKR